jgi:hypothetical protein
VRNEPSQSLQFNHMASSQLYLPHARGSLAPKDERHAVFAQWLIDTYGSAFLARGCGVLDVAGGEFVLAGQFIVCVLLCMSSSSRATVQ